MAGVLAGGYHGPPALTLARAFSSWTFDPWACAFVLLAGGCYLAAVRRARRTGTPWPLARAVSFAGVGLGMLVIATMSWTGGYAPVLFYARAAQTIVLLLVVPLFLALGRPITLAITVLPVPFGKIINATIRSRVAKVLTFPALVTPVLVVVPFLVYFTSWYAAYFHSSAVRELTYLALMAPGFAFFWTLLRVDPVPKEYPYLVSLWITGVEVIGDAILGVAVIGDAHLIGGAYYQALARPWGPSLRFDQMLGGGTLWVLGDIVGLPFLAAQLIHMIREDEADAAVIDAELDAGEASASAGAEAAVTEPATQPAGQPAGQPWWESDPRFTSRFKPADDQAGTKGD
jgi:cytochrome c oxidase assembly factor CtaG